MCQRPSSQTSKTTSQSTMTSTTTSLQIIERTLSDEGGECPMVAHSPELSDEDFEANYQPPSAAPEARQTDEKIEAHFQPPFDIRSPITVETLLNAEPSDCEHMNKKQRIAEPSPEPSAADLVDKMHRAVKALNEEVDSKFFDLSESNALLEVSADQLFQFLWDHVPNEEIYWNIGFFDQKASREEVETFLKDDPKNILFMLQIAVANAGAFR